MALITAALVAAAAALYLSARRSEIVSQVSYWLVDARVEEAALADSPRCISRFVVDFQGSGAWLTPAESLFTFQLRTESSAEPVPNGQRAITVRPTVDGQRRRITYEVECDLSEIPTADGAVVLRVDPASADVLSRPATLLIRADLRRPEADRSALRPGEVYRLAPKQWIDPIAKPGPKGYRANAVLTDPASPSFVAGALSPDGKRLALYGRGPVSLVDVANGAHRMLDKSGADGVLFSHDSRFLLLTTNDHTARLWDLANDTFRTFRRTQGQFAFSSDSRSLHFVGLQYERKSRDDFIYPLVCRAIELGTEEVASSDLVLQGVSADRSTPVDAIDLSTAIATRFGDFGISSDGKRIIAECADHHLRIWNVHNGELAFAQAHSPLDVGLYRTSIHMSRHTNEARVLYAKKPSDVWDLATCSHVRSFTPRHLAHPRFCSQTSIGNVICADVFGGHVVMLDQDQQDVLFRFHPAVPDEYVSSLSLSVDDRLLIVRGIPLNPGMLGIGQYKHEASVWDLTKVSNMMTIPSREQIPLQSAPQD